MISEHANVQALVLSAVAMRILLDLRGSNWDYSWLIIGCPVNLRAEGKHALSGALPSHLHLVTTPAVSAGGRTTTVPSERL